AYSGGGLTGLAFAYVNVLFRPFLWEAHNPQALFSALEVLVFWALILSRRRTLRAMRTLWRRHQLLRFSALLVLLSPSLIGMTMFNLGIVARQRALMWPFLFFLIEGLNVLSRARTTPRPARTRVAPTMAAMRPRTVAC